MQNVFDKNNNVVFFALAYKLIRNVLKNNVYMLIIVLINLFCLFIFKLTQIAFLIHFCLQKKDVSLMNKQNISEKPRREKELSWQ